MKINKRNYSPKIQGKHIFSNIGGEKSRGRDALLPI
jgi:hypothetical protein